MKGIECAFEGSVGAEPVARTAQSGREWLSFAVVVGEGEEAQWVQCAYFGDVEAMGNSLAKGMAVYCEARNLRLRTWQGRDGPGSGLSCVVSIIQPLGLIGHKRPKKARKEKAQPISAACELPLAEPTRGKPHVRPFDDPISDLF